MRESLNLNVLKNGKVGESRREQGKEFIRFKRLTWLKRIGLFSGETWTIQSKSKAASKWILRVGAFPVWISGLLICTNRLASYTSYSHKTNHTEAAHTVRVIPNTAASWRSLCHRTTEIMRGISLQLLMAHDGVSLSQKFKLLLSEGLPARNGSHRTKRR